MTTCGTCRFFRPYEGLNHGDCFVAPPTNTPTGQARYLHVTAKTPHCALHEERNGAPEQRGKTLAPTPGQAAKEAREERRRGRR